MVADVEQLISAIKNKQFSRRTFLGSAAALAVTGSSGAASSISPPLPVQSINHMTISVSDPTASLAWYQGLFGMPIAARQGNTIVLQVGDGPQFMAIGGSPSDNPRITHLCLAVENFDDERTVQILAEHGVAATTESGPMQSRVRMRWRRSQRHAGTVLRRPRWHCRAIARYELLRGSRLAGRRLPRDA